MESNITGKLKDAISSGFSSIDPERKRKVIRGIEKAEQKEETENKKHNRHFIDFLKKEEDLIEIYKIIKNSKLSVTEKRKKIKTYLKAPIEINDFFNSVLSSKTTKKHENTEATGSGSAGGYSMPLFSTTKGDVVDGVKTVREEVEKVETKEATSSSSSGQYSQPAIWAKSLSKKNWKGASTKYMPGAKRVQVKKKCKKFPYCNQGDISSLKIFENENVQTAIESVSSIYNLDKNIISKIIQQQIIKR